MALQILGAGVLIRLATDEEVRAVDHARHGRGFMLEPERSYRFLEPDRALAEYEAYVVSQTFVDFLGGDDEQRWVSAEHHGHRVSLVDDATMDLLKLADETADEGLIDLLGDMGMAELGVSRRALMSAPRRIDLSPALEARLAPLRRR